VSSPSRASHILEPGFPTHSGGHLGRLKKIERLFGMSLGGLYEIMSWPIAKLDPFPFVGARAGDASCARDLPPRLPRRPVGPRSCP
jgi:hypothetical protein